MSPIHIAHIITGLSIGGAEKVLQRLLCSMDRDAFENSVISLTDLGQIADALTKTGLQVDAMNFQKGSVNLSPMAQLGATLYGRKPDLVQTWMYHADLIGGMTAHLTTHAPVLWNLRQSTLDEKHSKASTIRTAKACAALSSSLPNTIICGSESARHVHTGLGYDATKMVVLHNGFDTDRYRRSSEQRTAFRSKIGVPSDVVLIGNPSRFDPQKDHKTFLQAAARVARDVPNAHFVLCGDHILPNNSELMSLIEELGLSKRTNVLGVLDDITHFYSGIDILALSSAYGEGAPNVVGEAMSAEIPCVATNVGDSAYIIGDTGLIVPPRDGQAFADALVSLSREAEETRRNRGLAARARIVHYFPLATMVQRYEGLYRRTYSQSYDF